MRTAIEHIPILISALAFLTMVCLFLLVFMYVRQNAKRREWVAKIQRSDINLELTEGEDPEKPSFKTENIILQQVLDFFGNLGKRFVPEKSSDFPQLRNKFLKAGLHRPTVPHIYWGTKCFFAICLPLIFFIGQLTIFQISSFFLTATGCLVFCLAGLYLPDLWLHMKISKRKRKILEALPDTLDLLVICVEAGLGLDAAIFRVADEIGLTSKELSEELKLLNLEMRAGMLRRDALRNLAKRTDLEALNSLVTLLTQTEKFGTSIVQALRVYSEAFRTERFQRAEEIAGKLPVKLLFPLILFIFPSLFVVILGPAAIRVYQVLLHP